MEGRSRWKTTTSERPWIATGTASDANDFEAEHQTETGSQKSSSQQTHRWREEDSNPRSPSPNESLSLAEREVPQRRKELSRERRLPGGTEGSNPLPSSAESAANFVFGREAWKGPRRRQGTIPTVSTSSGTDGSNPAPSSGESGANMIFGANAIDGRRGDRIYAQQPLGLGAAERRLGIL